MHFFDLMGHDTKYTEFEFLINKLVEIILEEKYKIHNLHTSISNNYMNEYYLGLINPFNLNSYDKDYRTLLHKAAHFGNLNLVKLLVENGALVNTYDVYGNTPLLSAIKTNNVSIVKFLVENGAYKNYKNLLNLNFKYDNFENGLMLNALNLNVFNYVLTQTQPNLDNFNYNQQRFILSKDVIRGGALHIAIINKSGYDMIHYLLVNGSNPNELDKYGLSPLHLASSSSFFTFPTSFTNTIHNNTSSNIELDIIKLLLKFKANVNLKSNRGLMPLNFSLISSNSLKTIHFLFHKTNKSYLNKSDEWGYSSLDRLWYRMNSFKYSNSIYIKTSSCSFVDEKLKLDTTIKSFQNLMKKFILCGAKLNKYKFSPHRLSYNYYTNSNLIMLLKCVLTLRRPVIDKYFDRNSFKTFLIQVFKCVIEKLAVKFSFLVKQKSIISDQRSMLVEANSNSSKLAIIDYDLELFESEFKDFVNELAQFECVLNALLTSGNLNYDNFSLSYTNFYLVNRIFNDYLVTRQIDVFENSDLKSFFFEIDESKTVIDDRKFVLSYVYNLAMNKLKSPLSLQETCRVKIRNSLKIFNKRTIYANLGLTKPLNEYLFYE